MYPVQMKFTHNFLNICKCLLSLSLYLPLSISLTVYLSPVGTMCASVIISVYYLNIFIAIN